jgi:pantetheine-phosphate adenylyltransferase
MSCMIAIVPGSFDPITNGHLNIIERCSELFDTVIVASLVNDSKQYLFTEEERNGLILKSVTNFQNVNVVSFSGLLVDFTKKYPDPTVIVKGLRTVSDYEYELQMANLNRNLHGGVETFFMLTDPKYSYLSSSVVKGVAKHGGDIEEFVPKHVSEALKLKFKGG